MMEFLCRTWPYSDFMAMGLMFISGYWLGSRMKRRKREQNRGLWISEDVSKSEATINLTPKKLYAPNPGRGMMV